MKIKINEHQLRILTEAMKDEFSFDVLRGQSFDTKVEYCEQMCGFPIGNGSSRMVFQINDNKCLKLAKNQKGIAQNQKEASILNDYYKSQFMIFPKIYGNESDTENYEWLVCEYVLPAEEEDFKQVVGYDFSVVQAFIISIYNRYARRGKEINGYDLSDEDFENIIEYDEQHSYFFNELQDYIGNYQPTVGDYLRLENWGMVQRNGEPMMVILDDGIDEEIFNKYYKK